MATVPVDLNRGRTHQFDVPDSVTVEGSFTVELENHGAPTHVHLNFDDDLSRIATLTDGNHYVEGDATHEVFVDVEPISEPVTGRLKVVTGYGTETEYVSVTVEPGRAGKPPVEVDESLGKPNAGKSAGSKSPDYVPLQERAEEAIPEGPQLAVGIVAAVAVVLAVIVGLSIGSTAVLVGTGIVVGAAIAAVLLSRE
ncbi:hypothetical protein AArcSl_0293 [Halalkaliarchaeum desulfuricum]|uniref:Uncharacterized protein n=1 Tax=Halalkaliarchaeum desulfuricum TaxID=2055893 RepID=A0A343TFS6_9EURY|nr:hypothetical protein [Halalkaliarchaeum desulfuricum]AUX07948.1 hypothetical protein AArcSl_0293 [Halalkaliarchaeum desulfuricum]